MDCAQFDFAVALLKGTGRYDQSTISSPISISTALFMVYLAADGETKTELSKMIGSNFMV